MSGYTLYFELVSFLDGLVDNFKSKLGNPSNSTISIQILQCDTQTFFGD